MSEAHVMVSKVALHEMLDALGPEQLQEAEQALRAIATGGTATAYAALPGAVRSEHNLSGRDAAHHPFFDRHVSLDELAREQGVKPIRTIDELRGDFWPADEAPDDFVAKVREWRREA